MDKYYELMSYDDLDYYYVFADAKTYDVLFLNQSICNFLGLKLDNCIGKKCYEVIYNRNKVCPNCVNEELISSNFTSMEAVTPLKQMNINCNISLIDMDNRLVRVTKLPINPKNSNQVSAITDNDILADLMKNLKNDNFKIHLQPKFEIIKTPTSYKTKLAGAEALVRRNDINLNEIISPDEFISLYENMSIVRHIDLFVLERVCEILSTINKSEKFVNAPFNISVNFSCATLLEFNCVSNIKSVCDKFNIPYSCITIEIAKDKFIDDHKSFIKMSLKSLSLAGFLIALSNVNILNPKLCNIDGIDFNEIKISRNLILDNNTNYNEYTKNLFETVIASYNDNCNVVAVGIENDVQMDFFHSVNCVLQQGHLHCRHLNTDDFLNQFVNC